MLTEGKEINQEVVSDLEKIRGCLNQIRPTIPKELIFPDSLTLKVSYTLEDYQSRVNVLVEPRYLKYLGMEIPDWVLKLMRK